MILYHRHRRIDFPTSVWWYEKQTLLKASFPLDIKSHQPSYEIPFGVVTRTSKHPSEKGQFEVPALRWADLSDSRGGVSLLNNCKYGYDAYDSTLRLTLLRSPRFAHPIEPMKLTDNRVSDQGHHQFAYALLPHQDDWKKAQIVRAAQEFNAPALIFPERISRRIPPLVSSSHTNIIIDSIKKAEEGNDLILRVYEAHGEQREATLEFGFRILRAFECNLMEQNVNNIAATKTKLKVKFKPFEVKTLKVSLRPLTKRS
jgi:alpha-mannosidase